MNNSKKKNKTVYNFCWLEKFLVKHSSYFGILSLAFNRSLYQKYPKISFFMLSRYSVFVFTLAAFLLFFALESNFELTGFQLVHLRNFRDRGENITSTVDIDQPLMLQEGGSGFKKAST